MYWKLSNIFFTMCDFLKKNREKCALRYVEWPKCLLSLKLYRIRDMKDEINGHARIIPSISQDTSNFPMWLRLY